MGAPCRAGCSGSLGSVPQRRRGVQSFFHEPEEGGQSLFHEEARCSTDRACPDSGSAAALLCLGGVVSRAFSRSCTFLRLSTASFWARAFEAERVSRARSLALRARELVPERPSRRTSRSSTTWESVVYVSRFSAIIVEWKRVAEELSGDYRCKEMR